MKMITVRIDEDTALEMLMERVEHWTDDTQIQALYESMYQSYIDCGCFDDNEFNVATIVDNDFVNWCSIVRYGDDDFEKIKAIYDEQGIGDCSCEHDYFSFIEAVDDSENPTAFLMRY